MTGRTFLGEPDQLPEERPRVGGPERATGPAGVRPVLLAGEAVDEVGDVLPPQDLLGGQVGRGRADLAVDHRQRVLEAGSCSPRPVTKARSSALPVRRPARPTRCR